MKALLAANLPEDTFPGDSVARNLFTWVEKKLLFTGIASDIFAQVY